jgi:ring-1,2-phenylacetyl-CoA epoxidase subunit PaaB
LPNHINVKSLDPRVNRLPALNLPDAIQPKTSLDQLGTFEVFVQPKDGKPFQHEGIVHAPELEMAYILAKEAFTRRFTCISLYVVDTRDVFVSAMSEGDQNAYDSLADIKSEEAERKQFEIYHLMKRGKQHVHAGTVEATSPTEAMITAKQLFGSKTVYNVWAIPTKSIRFTLPDEKDLWNTLPEKKFRDATDYKGGDKLKEFLERSR